MWLSQKHLMRSILLMQTTIARSSCMAHSMSNCFVFSMMPSAASTNNTLPSVIRMTAVSSSDKFIYVHVHIYRAVSKSLIRKLFCLMSGKKIVIGIDWCLRYVSARWTLCLCNVVDMLINRRWVHAARIPFRKWYPVDFVTSIRIFVHLDHLFDLGRTDFDRRREDSPNLFRFNCRICRTSESIKSLSGKRRNTANV